MAAMSDRYTAANLTIRSGQQWCFCMIDYCMEIDHDKIDDAVLGLLWLTLHDERRAWKGFDWGRWIDCIKRG